MTKEQQDILDEIERTVELGIFTPMQAITRYVSFYRGGSYEGITEEEAGQLLKELVNKYL
ncbi:hypothetical protein [Enterococcus pallens]|uniref:Uncharacterized protein n=1 Tax=Enterococcus pallens ATCC BAA-351 TaxID=1158607 RepID=R2PP96_9ENTE|nr:hypothetical protein [Enterococcus pallens]EOH86337.1 hypothetical protein UAU_05259 [Enterococcus pallens ATCC BAA-351]EOU09442.1 hypothetical protein I588_05175 [Enterococcus pallens ATCC BAA-351]OJG77560.1 hypothetical protein RV10_GL002394 [Enterococcus pallens]